MKRYKFEELDYPLLPWEEPKREEEEGQPYVPKRKEREWTQKRESEIAQMRLWHEDKDVDDIRIMLNKIDEEKALKTLKKPFKLQSCRRDIFTKKEPIDRMGMIAPVNTGTYRGPRGSAYRKYNVHESPIVENGLFDDPHKEELDWILDKHDTSYKPNCFDTLPPYATQLARSTYGEPSPSTRLGRKRPLPVVPLPKVQKKMKPDSGTSGSGMVSKTLALSSRVSNSKASGSIQPSSSFQSSSSSRPSSSVPSISFQASSSSRAPSSTPFEEYDKEDFDDFEQFDFGRYGFY